MINRPLALEYDERVLQAAACLDKLPELAIFIDWLARCSRRAANKNKFELNEVVLRQRQGQEQTLDAIEAVLRDSHQMLRDFRGAHTPKETDARVDALG